MKFTKAALAIALVAAAAISGADAKKYCGVSCDKELRGKDGIPKDKNECHCFRGRVCLSLIGKGLGSEESTTSLDSGDLAACSAKAVGEINDNLNNPAKTSLEVAERIAAELQTRGYTLFQEGINNVAKRRAAKNLADKQEAARLQKIEDERLAAEAEAEAARVAEAKRLAEIARLEEEARLEAIRVEEEKIAAGRVEHGAKLQHMFATEPFFKVGALKAKVAANGPQWVTAMAADVSFAAKPPSHWYNGQVAKVGETYVFPFIRVDGVNAKGDLILTFPAGSGVGSDGKVHKFGEVSWDDGFAKIKPGHYVYTEDPEVVAERAAQVAAAQLAAASAEAITPQELLEEGEEESDDESVAPVFHAEPLESDVQPHFDELSASRSSSGGDDL